MNGSSSDVTANAAVKLLSSICMVSISLLDLLKLRALIITNGQNYREEVPPSLLTKRVSAYLIEQGTKRDRGNHCRRQSKLYSPFPSNSSRNDQIATKVYRTRHDRPCIFPCCRSDAHDYENFSFFLSFVCRFSFVS